MAVSLSRRMLRFSRRRRQARPVSPRSPTRSVGTGWAPMAVAPIPASVTLRGRRFAFAAEGERRGGSNRGAHFDDGAADGEIALAVGADEVGSRRQLPERELPQLVGHGKGARRPQGRHHHPIQWIPRHRRTTWPTIWPLDTDARSVMRSGWRSGACARAEPTPAARRQTVNAGTVRRPCIPIGCVRTAPGRCRGRSGNLPTVYDAFTVKFTSRVRTLPDTLSLILMASR